MKWIIINNVPYMLQTCMKDYVAEGFFILGITPLDYLIVLMMIGDNCFQRQK